MIYLSNGVLHTERTLKAAQGTYKHKGRDMTSTLVDFTDNPTGALGCVMVHRLTGLPLAGRRADNAQLSDTLPPRIYKSPDAAAIAIITIGKWSLGEFQVKFVQPSPIERGN